MYFDVLIKGGTVVDGSGQRPGFRADVGIVGDKIAAVDRIEGAEAAEVIDATGKVVSPGFIDVHVHSEIALLGGPHRYGGLLQGVTTHLLAPDGFGWAPLPADLGREMWSYTLFAYGEADLTVDWPTPEAYLSLFAGNTPANVVPQVPHCAVRLAVIGWEPRPATDAELEAMKRITRQWMEAGAVCLCLGLDYQPSAFSTTEELIELSKVVREFDGVYAAHIRNNGLGKVGAWRETMEIGERANIPVHISHEFVNPVTEPLLEEAAQRCDLTFESYMYPAGCTHLTLLLPLWAQAGGNEALRRRLKVPEDRRRMAEALEAVLAQRAAMGGDVVMAANQTGRYIGRGVVELARELGMGLGELAVRLLEEEDPYALMVMHHGGTPQDHRTMIEKTINHPRMMVASDGIYHGPHGHPRGYGCFARVLRLCVRELQAVSLEQAIYKMSGFPAERFRIKDRGLLRPGYGADIVIFDPETVADRSTWEEPWLEPVGIDRVLVNGESVVAGGRPTGALPGRVLRPLV